MIHVSNCRNYKLDQSWKTHRKAVKLQGLSPASANLLLFYAVECGLKSLLLKKHLWTTCPTDRGNLLRSHDLAKIFMGTEPSKAEVEKAAPPSPLHLKWGSEKVPHIKIGDVHSVWRYGLPIDRDDEKKVIAWLQKVNQYIALKRIQP
ncbi:MAG: hypothetical protein HW380_1084 [Magnetococcales bacterium]|nr:hypothetical protein [Magnetococcales bacterium]HIJ83134.1 hypothetical protein [Magnetococcales bacterium]